MNPGDYTIAFEFFLPNNIPSSILFERNDIMHEPEAKIVYKVITNLHTTTKQKMTYKSMIVVHEPPVQFQTNTGISDTKPITVWCTQDKGPTTLTVNFQKNVFYGNEMAVANVQVDNSKCDSRITEIEFQVT